MIISLHSIPFSYEVLNKAFDFVCELIRKYNGIYWNDHNGMEMNGMELNVFKKWKRMELSNLD